MAENEVISASESLKHEASELKAKAETAHQAWQAATRRYERGSWPKLAVVFFLAPTIVVIVRLHLYAWGYYVAGAVFAVSAFLMVLLDKAAVAERERASQKAETARLAHAEALRRIEAAERQSDA